ncbi:MAG: 50S ribosomal protein L20 [Methanomicrobia archaeon]|nr:50S ribosomal protein L20 [Methanomicrobia archaeon]
MVRIKTNVARRKKVKRVLKQTKGQFGHRSRRYKQAKKSLMRGLVYHYRDRKVKKREFRNIWIIRINAACQEQGVTYSRFMNGLKKANVVMDRKMLAELAVNAPEAFQALMDVSKKALE